MTKKIVIAGPPQSGKSCLREGLKKAVMAIKGAPYPYVITACPDGEGSWFQETANRSSELAKSLKRSYKGKFTEAFVQRIASSVEKCSLPMTLVDIGGIPSKENYAICRHATDIILLAGDSKDATWQQRLSEWRVFAKKLNLNIIAEVYSDYRGSVDNVYSTEGVFRGSVHYMERGEDISDREGVKALAEFLSLYSKEEE